jgi:ketosteroid isomerase-like protein
MGQIEEPNWVIFKVSDRREFSIQKELKRMSDENVKVVRGLYEAFAKGDIPTIIGALDPKIEWWEAENHIYADGNPYVGPDAVLQGVFMRLGSEWDGFAVGPKEVLDAGNTVIGQGYYSGTYKQSGKSVRSQFAHFFTFKEGRIVKFQQYTDTAQFKEAVAAG